MPAKNTCVLAIELRGVALDWAVADIQYRSAAHIKDWVMRDHKNASSEPPKYSSDWLLGGPLVSTHKIALQPAPLTNCDGDVWLATATNPKQHSTVCAGGSHPLEAAMRVLVLLETGETVNVPDTLAIDAGLRSLNCA